MIRVNLLRATGLSAAPSMTGATVSDSSQQSMGGLKLFVIALFPIAFYAYEYTHLASLKSESEVLEAEVKKVDAKKAAFGDAGPKVEKYTKQKAKIDTQMLTIRELTKNRLREVKALDSLQEITPGDVWFESIEMRDGVVKAKGFAQSNEGLTALSSKLTNSAIFSRFEPKGQSYEPGPNNTKVVKFEVEFRVGRQDQE